MVTKKESIMPNWSQPPLWHMNIYLTISPFPFVGFPFREGVTSIRISFFDATSLCSLLAALCYLAGYAIFGFCVSLVFAIWPLFCL